MPASPSVRLNKYISESGICSRREADRHIEQGHVLLNGKPAQMGDQVGPRDEVTVNGHIIEPKQAEDAIYLAFNKPVGITTTSEPGVQGNIVRYINHAARIFPIGRLDKDSSGLIFLTSDGDIVNKILRAGNQHEKEYLVTVNRPLTDAVLEQMAQGVPMLGVVTKKCVIKKETPFIFRITLVQGLNRQVRRMAEHFNYEVVKLERVRIMNVSLKGLAVGDWRDLTAAELAGIMQMVQKSSGTEEASGGKRGTKKSETKTDAERTASPRKTTPGKTVTGAPRKPGPPTPYNPSGTGWWGPRPEKTAGGPKPSFSGGGGQKPKSRGARPGAPSTGTGSRPRPPKAGGGPRRSSGSPKR